MSTEKYLAIESTVIKLFRTCKIVTSAQVARFFPEYAKPQNQATKFLRDHLIERGLVETKESRGKPRGMNEVHLYRLTKKGRITTGEDFHPVPFESMKLGHWLKIGDVFLDMYEIEPPSTFITEIREKLTDREGVERNFSPDIFACWKKNLMFIEVQRSLLSRVNWRNKWNMYEQYFEAEACQRGSFQQYLGPVKPRIICVTSQRKEQVCNQVNISVEVVQSMADLAAVIDVESSEIKFI